MATLRAQMRAPGRPRKFNTVLIELLSGLSEPGTPLVLQASAPMLLAFWRAPDQHSAITVIVVSIMDYRKQVKDSCYVAAMSMSSRT